MAAIMHIMSLERGETHNSNNDIHNLPLTKNTQQLYVNVVQWECSDQLASGCDLVLLVDHVWVRSLSSSSVLKSSQIH